MTIKAKIILGSEYNGKRITTFELTYNRYIHSELLTHRVHSKNSASSRAIPFKKMLKNIWNDMAMPIHWGQNQSGMQADFELGPFKKWLAKKVWRTAGYTALGFAWILDKIGAHKQLANRCIEPWSHITVILTTTELDNFFELRCHKDAQPEIHELANQMRKCVEEYDYKKLKADEWHLPYVTDEEKEHYSIFKCIQVSVARCARVSYLTHDGLVSVFDKDVKLYERLVGSVPLHASPAEHQATGLKLKSDERYQGNFFGFLQFRKLLEDKMDGINNKLISSVFDFK